MKCEKCGFENTGTDAKFCSKCGSVFEAPAVGQAFPQPGYTSNLPSGNDPGNLDEVRRMGFNWGATSTGLIWTIVHKLYGWFACMVALIIVSIIIAVVSIAIPEAKNLIHIVTVISYTIMIYLGIKGNELAYTNRPFKSMEQFRFTQKEWGIWGLTLFILSLPSMIFSWLINLNVIRINPMAPSPANMMLSIAMIIPSCLICIAIIALTIRYFASVKNKNIQ